MLNVIKEKDETIRIKIRILNYIPMFLSYNNLLLEHNKLHEHNGNKF